MRRLSVRSIAALFGVAVLVVVAGQTIRVLAAAGMEPPPLYQKDIVQDWLMARAIRDGLNPYIAEYDIAMRYLPDLEPYMKHHAATHPPAAALLTVPLGLLSLHDASLAWLFFELVLTAASVVVLYAALRPTTLRWQWAAFGMALLLVWSPTLYELLDGQWNLVLLLLTTGAFLAYSGNHLKLAGVLLGLAVSFKLIPAMLVLFFIARRSWKVVCWTLGTCVLATAISVAILGIDAGREFLASGVTGAAGWRASEGNYSLFGAVSHLFEGSAATPPLVSHMPSLVWPIAGAGLLLLVAFASRAWRDAPADIGFALGCVLMVVASPVAWQHYLVLLCWPVVVVIRRLRELSWPTGLRKLALLAMFLLSVPAPFVLATIVAFFAHGGAAGSTVSVATVDTVTLSPLANLPLFGLAAGPLLLFALLLRFESTPQNDVAVAVIGAPDA